VAQVTWATGPVRNRAFGPSLDVISGAALASALPLTWLVGDPRLDPYFRQPLAIVLAILGAWGALLVARTVHSTRAHPAGWPTTPPTTLGSLTDRQRGWAVLAVRIAIGVGIGWVSAWLAVAAGVRLAAVAPGLVLVVGALTIHRAAGRAGRAVGVWDALPQWAPQPVVLVDGEAAPIASSSGTDRFPNPPSAA
jgi:hypothetical protein